MPPSPSRRVLPPSPERRVKKLRDELQLPPPIAALGEAVARVTEELVELRGANRGLEAENAAHRRASLEVMSLNAYTSRVYHLPIFTPLMFGFIS